jgi:hypothetical protein
MPKYFPEIRKEGYHHYGKGLIFFTYFYSMMAGIEEGRAQVKVLIKNLALFFLCMSQQAVSADIIPNSAVGIFFPKTEGTKTLAARAY